MQKIYSEVGIYKRKQGSKKTRKKELDQESDQENKKTTKKKRKIFLDHFLGRVLVFFLFFFFSYFLVFFYKFPPLGYCVQTLVIQVLFSLTDIWSVIYIIFLRLQSQLLNLTDKPDEYSPLKKNFSGITSCRRTVPAFPPSGNCRF